MMKKPNLFLFFTAFLTCGLLFIACKKEETLLNPGSFTVIFNANGGDGRMKPQPFYEFDFIQLTPNAFKRKEYNFIYWNTKADGTGTIYNDKHYLEVTKNILLYAQWDPVNNAIVPCPGMPTVRDIDGNTYPTVQIGSQCWMRENLKTKRLNTGILIPNIPDEYQWKNSTK
jgi:hypothetical protein